MKESDQVRWIFINSINMESPTDASLSLEFSYSKPMDVQIPLNFSQFFRQDKWIYKGKNSAPMSTDFQRNSVIPERSAWGESVQNTATNYFTFFWVVQKKEVNESL